MIWHICNTCRFRIKVNGRAKVSFLLGAVYMSDFIPGGVLTREDLDLIPG